MLKFILSFLLLTTLSFEHTLGYSALADAKIIAQYKREQARNHAKIARTLVHQTNWAAMGTISTSPSIVGYPMVNIISVDDGTATGTSTGKIHFLLTDLDYTGKDWKESNKVTLLFSNDQNLICTKNGTDPMEPTCPRTIISGKIVELSKTDRNYQDILAGFIRRHPAAVNWLKAHAFYMCELEIENIFVLDWYGGPHTVTAEDYYSTDPETNEVI